MITPHSIAGRERYIQRRREVQHARLLSALRKLEAHEMSVDDACKECIELQYAAERRGRAAAVRFLQRGTR